MWQFINLKMKYFFKFNFPIVKVTKNLLIHQNLNFRSYENLMESLKLVIYDDIIPEKKKRHFNSDWLLY